MSPRARIILGVGMILVWSLMALTAVVLTLITLMNGMMN